MGANDKDRSLEAPKDWIVISGKPLCTQILDEYAEEIEFAQKNSHKMKCSCCFKHPAGHDGYPLLRLDFSTQMATVRVACRLCLDSFESNFKEKFGIQKNLINQLVNQDRPCEALELIDQTSALCSYFKQQKVFEESGLQRIRQKLFDDYLINTNRTFKMFYKRGMYEYALPLATLMLSTVSKYLEKENPAYVFSLDKLADTYQALGRPDEAETKYREALEFRRKTLGEEDHEYKVNLNKLAALLIRTGRAAEVKSKGELKERTVRIFISSTFRDMHAERDFLVKKTFPELRERCYQRGLEFVWVDLRWGVTEEEAESGDVLSICLKEIDHCRPFFVGLLGERYGWVPDKISEETLQQFPWLKNSPHCSLTELEILSGALMKPKDKAKAYFYFRRNPDTAPNSETSDETEAGLKRLKDLKNRIRKSQFPVSEYVKPFMLHELLVEQLWLEIDQQFPASTELFEVTREALGHESYMDTHLKNFISRKGCLPPLESLSQSQESILVIAGETGIGKTALLANWVSELRKNNPRLFLISHFVGSTPFSTEPDSMIRRIMLEMDLRYNFGEEIPNEPTKMHDTFLRWLKTICGNTLYILIDGLDLLKNSTSGAPLSWLPEHIPWGVRFILTVRHGQILELLRKRNCKIVKLEGFSEPERNKFLKSYLSPYGKRLNNERIDQIISSNMTANPGFLRLLLDELIVFGIHEELDKRIQYYLEAHSTEELFIKVLERLENDIPDSNIVQNALSLLWTAHYGLSENELLKLLGGKDDMLPRHIWAQVYYAIKSYLIECNGLLTISQEHLKNAVHKRYLGSRSEQNKIHNQLAEFFEKSESTARKAEELPWQLFQTDQYTKLRDTLTDPKVLRYLLINLRSFEITNYWAKLSASYDMVDSYHSKLKTMEENNIPPQEVSLFCSDVGRILSIAGFYQNAETFYRKAIEIVKKDNDTEVEPTVDPYKIKLTISLADQMCQKGDLQEAKDLYLNLLEKIRHISGTDSEDFNLILNNLGSLLQTLGDLGGAENCYRRALASSKRIRGEKYDLTISTQSNLGCLLLEKGELDQAELLLLDSLAKEENKWGSDHPELSTLLSNLGQLYEKKENYGLAESYLTRTLSIREKTLGQFHPKISIALNNMGSVQKAAGKYKEANKNWIRALKIAEQSLGANHLETAIILSNLASLNLDLDNLEQAEQNSRKVSQIVKESQGVEHNLYIESIRNLGRICARKRDHMSAAEYYKNALQLTKKKYGEQHEETINHIGYVAYQLFEAKDYVEAEKYYQLALNLRKNIPNTAPLKLADSFNNVAAALEALDKFPESELMYREALKIREEVLGLRNVKTAEIQHNLALVLTSQGKFQEALQLNQQAVTTKKYLLGEKDESTLVTLSNYGWSLLDCENPSAAISAFQELMKLCSQLFGEEHEKTISATLACAHAFFRNNDFEKAYSLHEVCLAWQEKALGSNHLQTAETIYNLASIKERQKQIEGALKLYRQAYFVKESILGMEHSEAITILNKIVELVREKKPENNYCGKAGPMPAPTTHLRNEKIEEVLRLENELNNNYQKQDYVASLSLANQILSIYSEELSSSNPNVITYLNITALLLQKLGNNIESLFQFKKALDAKINAIGDDHPDCAYTLREIANLEASLGESQAAILNYQKAVLILETTLGEDYFRLPEFLHNLAVLKHNSGTNEGVVSMLERCIEINERQFGPKHPEVLKEISTLATVLEQTGNIEAAMKLKRFYGTEDN